MNELARLATTAVRDFAGLTLLGRGFCSDVYSWGEGRVLKLFHEGCLRARAEREYLATRAVHAAGLPAPAAYELVEIGGRQGIIFERIDGPSVLDHVRARPWMLFDAVRKLAELHVRINGCPAPAGLPSQRDRIAEGIDAAMNVPESKKQEARRRLADLPDGTAVCHGDFHPGNVLLAARGPVVIDWDTATCGDPMGDLASTSRLLQNAHLPPWAPGYLHLLLRCTRPLLHRSYLRTYLKLRQGTRKELEAWRVPLEVAANPVNG
jgi:uncharacterized protein (TIGR02172 family)